jgi:hypothetical protein
MKGIWIDCERVILVDEGLEFKIDPEDEAVELLSRTLKL